MFENYHVSSCSFPCHKYTKLFNVLCVSDHSSSHSSYNCLKFFINVVERNNRKLVRMILQLTTVELNSYLRDHILIYISQGKKCIFCNIDVAYLLIFCDILIMWYILILWYCWNFSYRTLVLPHISYIILMHMIRALIPAKQNSCSFPSFLWHPKNIWSSATVIQNAYNFQYCWCFPDH